MKGKKMHGNKYTVKTVKTYMAQERNLKSFCLKQPYSYF